MIENFETDSIRHKSQVLSTHINISVLYSYHDWCSSTFQQDSGRIIDNNNLFKDMTFINVCRKDR